ncbi:helix-turn-helix transcriptional regulator [Solwaraspora sp. WMMD1047]|uniref:helix-turn-helix domain-containing protein n=1 Tax=Solwaraspora sp. WMMD1047 TaxID=3016102 RepID=UPI002417C93E|nr:helix-turn-helix transcriptional regulator [Solwaraspora sp. WMMD1047]MDG4828499.1 helix-turn-helix transcriptional regulator [Solwaraspora sp. WMMD1047]
MTESRLLAILGEKLKFQRELRELTQQQLAELAGVSQAAVARVERGGRSASVPLLERLFAALDTQLAISLEPLDAHLDAALARLASQPLEERLAASDLHSAMKRLAELPYLLTGATAAVLQGVPLPAEATDIAIRWADADRFTGWLTEVFAYRWNPRWEDFGGLPIDPREPGEHRWRTTVGELTATMYEQLPAAIQVRHGDRTYPVVPLPLIELADPVAADLLRRHRLRLAADPGSRPVATPAPG